MGLIDMMDVNVMDEWMKYLMDGWLLYIGDMNAFWSKLVERRST